MMNGMNGLNDMFTALLDTPEKRSVANRLAEIEAADRDRCSHCGGEDCICCEIYRDRITWEDPVTFFSSHEWYDDRYSCDEWDDEEFDDELDN